MAQSVDRNRLTPSLRRDLYFGDLALARREAITRLAAAGLCFSLFLARYFVASGTLSHVANVYCGLAGFGFATRLRLDWKKMRAAAEGDADLMADERLAIEDRRASRVASFRRGILALMLVASVLMVSLGATSLVAEARAWFQPSPPPTVELVDVTLVNGPADFPGPITIDVTGDRITRIAPYDIRRALNPKGEHIRSFEALGKFVVEGTLDLSQPDPLEVAKRVWMRPIDIESRGDLIVLDVDPRARVVTLDEVTAAVINGNYLSRADIRRAAYRAAVSASNSS